MDQSCLFCGIVAGSVPSLAVYQDERVMAFLDPYPTTRGHVLVIPKTHSVSLLDTTPDMLAVLLPTIQRISRALCETLEVEGFNLIQNNGKAAGQVMPHLHFHLIPRRPDDGLKQWPSIESSVEDRRALAARIASNLRV